MVKLSRDVQQLKYREVLSPTVFLGSTFAIWMAASTASKEGLQRIRGLEWELSLSASSSRTLSSTSTPARTALLSNASV